MPTQKPRFSVAIDEELLRQVDDYKFDNRIKSQNQAINDLLRAGIEELKGRQNIPITQELSVDEDGAPSKTELNLLKKYRALDEHGKGTVNYIVDRETIRMTQIERIKRDMEAAEETIVTFLLPYSVQPASAGTGMFLGPDNFEMIRVRQNDMTRRAAFSVPVRGDSMEPEYHDGDVLLVQATEDVPAGEIGVFTLDGRGFVKKRGERELISLNPEYDPIPLTESVRCNGRVIGVLDPSWIVEK